MTNALFTVDFECVLRAMDRKEKEKMSKQKKLSEALDKLAALYENGELRAATNPVEFIEDVIDEIKLLRKLVGRTEKIAKTLNQMKAFVAAEGACDDAPDGECYCHSSECEYCKVARLVDAIG